MSLSYRGSEGITPLDASKRRLQAMRHLTTLAMGRMCDAEIGRALALAEAAVERAEEVVVAWGSDELVLDRVVSALAVLAELAKDADHAAHREKIRNLFKRAVARRLAALSCEGEERPA